MTELPSSTKSAGIDRTLSVAPMMAWTDRHCRFFHRLLAPRALLYTEMVTTGAMLFGDCERHLRHDIREYPLALQLGGSEPEALARCAQIAETYGYQEVNLNIGCPSDRVQSGQFGACLMRSPQLVAECVAAMKSATTLPVTVKTRIGVDEDDSEQFLRDFIDPVAEAGCRTFIVHARKAWLQGLSPKENREVPELDYERVARMRKLYPRLEFVLNGGLRSLEDSRAELSRFDGVMLGRAAYQTPMLLREIHLAVYPNISVLSEREIIDALIGYAREQCVSGQAQLKHISRHLHGLFNGRPGARRWRRCLSERAHRADASPDLIAEAYALLGRKYSESMETS